MHRTKHSGERKSMIGRKNYIRTSKSRNREPIPCASAATMRTEDEYKCSVRLCLCTCPTHHLSTRLGATLVLYAVWHARRRIHDGHKHPRRCHIVFYAALPPKFAPSSLSEMADHVGVCPGDLLACDERSLFDCSALVAYAHGRFPAKVSERAWLLAQHVLVIIALPEEAPGMVASLAFQPISNHRRHPFRTFQPHRRINYIPMLSYRGHIVNEYFRCFTLSCGDIHCAFPMRFAFSHFLFALSICPRHTSSSSCLCADISFRYRDEPACRAQSFRQQRYPWACSSAFLETFWGFLGHVMSLLLFHTVFCVLLSRLGLPLRLCGRCPCRSPDSSVMLHETVSCLTLHVLCAMIIMGSPVRISWQPLACLPIVSYRRLPALSSLFHVFFTGDP